MSTATNFIVGRLEGRKGFYKKNNNINKKPLLFLPLAGSFCQSRAVQTGD